MRDDFNAPFFHQSSRARYSQRFFPRDRYDADSQFHRLDEVVSGEYRREILPQRIKGCDDSGG